ncbi:MFS general substrate transporter [Plenodomus tracheiphilus IPT5]|uniref:MFS general substrate transporter n=1 Tax=Plenodomus tracheiphilus IPT5 TaxID=1408161 RepID=A0A6A7B0J0_9PLEO|nr:MFS general substrate transporter [Plenodomus tracheiphilus IPT5]
MFLSGQLTFIDDTKPARPALSQHRSLSRFLSNRSTPQNIGEKVTKSQQWRILSSASLVAFTVIGFTQSFGVFQAHYGRIQAVNEGVLRLDDMAERALLSSIGSLGNGGIVAIFAVFYYPHLPEIGKSIRLLCFVGTLLVALGFGTASLSHNIWTLVGCQGLLVGVGTGLLINVLAPILPEYFPHRSGLAQGTMYASAALGGTVWSIALTKLLESKAIGIRSTLQILGGVSGALLGIASLLSLPPRKYEQRSTRIVALKTFKDPIFFFLAVVNMIHPLTLAIPMTFGPEFAESVGVGVTKASQLLAMNSAVGIPSRLGAGALADKIGHQNMLMAATAIYAVATWALWLPSALRDDEGLYIAMSVCHGIISGVFNTVCNSAQKQLFGDEMYYPKNGAITTIRGFGYVFGVPIAGALIKRVADDELDGSDFIKPIVYTGVLLLVSLICLTIVRMKDAQRNGWKLAR